MLAAAIWHNVFNPVNVDGDADGLVSPIDALLVINELNRRAYSDSESSVLPKQVDAPQVPFLDVSCDGLASPLDALLVVNYINAGHAPGNANRTGGRYATSACSPQLQETDSFHTELTQSLVLPDDTSGVKVYFQAPAFDLTSRRSIRDAFELEVTDANGMPVTLPYASGRDAVYNWSEDFEPLFGAAVATETRPAGQDSSATINLSGLPAGTQIQVRARLVNNDLDDNTSVLIRGVEIVDAPTPAPQGFRPTASRLATVAPIDFAQLADISGSFTANYARTSLSGSDNQLITELSVTNRGSQTVNGRLLVVVENISELEAYAMQPDGFTPAGDPYFDLTHELDDQPLRPGDTVRSREIRFLNNSGSRFQYRLRTLGSLNAAPSGFTSTPLAEIESGRTYRYRAVASDPDGQTLVYSLQTGPSGMQVDAATGEVSWTTSAADIGRQRIVLRATDPHGLFVEQSFDLAVLASLQNRPPMFVSDPVTEATASSGFEITTLATGVEPAGVSVISGFRGPRIVSINAGEQTLGVYAGANNDRFDDATVYSTGQPLPHESVIDVGYSVNIGLPAFLARTESNDIFGLDQGDINGDGILDLVAMFTFDSPARGQRNQWRITTMLGDGNGGFGEPIEILSQSIGTNLYDPRNLLLRDLDNDGDLDVIAAERRTNPRIVTILGNGDGTFGEVREQTFGKVISDFRAADIDEDGVLDLIGRTAVLGFGATYEAMWMRGLGDGTFGEPTLIGPAGSDSNCCYTTQARPYDVADLNGDDHLDLALLGNGPNLQIYHSDGAGNFSLAANFDAPGTVTPFNWISAADFTGDGEVDLLYHNSTNMQLELLISDGSGVNFSHRSGAYADAWLTNYAGSDDPVDIDGDGDLDLVFGHNSADLTSPKIGINDRAGNFVLSEYPMLDFVGHFDPMVAVNGEIARGAMFADYNRDGVTDYSYFTSGSDFNGVGIRLGTRPGEFGSTRTIGDPTLGHPNASDDETHAADFDGDGDIDLLNLRSSLMSLGNGDGTFAEPFLSLGVSRPGSFASIADFNQDGLPDVVATRANQNGSRYYVALSNGDGTFTVSDDQTVEASFYGYSATQIADFNNDGYPDFLAKSSVERQIDVHLNDPDNPGVFERTFRLTLPSPAQGVNVNSWDHAFSAADVTGDGLVDLVFASKETTDEPMKIVVLAGDGLGNFSPHSELFGYHEDEVYRIYGGNFYYPGDFNTGDIDEDGDIDLVSVTTYGPRTFLNDGTGHFTFFQHLTHPGALGRGRDSYLIDFDEDGHLDLLQTSLNAQGPLGIRRGNGDGTFRPAERVGVVGQASQISFADLDHDGHLDLVHQSVGVGNYRPETISIMSGVRDGLVDLLTVDLNGDGNEEVLAVNEHSDRLQLFVGDNLGGFTRQPDLLTGRAPRAVTTADLDGDGQLELITANRAGRSLTVFSGSLASGYSGVDFAVPGGAVDVHAEDIDGDGHIDLVALDNANQALWIFSGNGTRTLAEPVAVAVGDAPGRFVLADATGDGQLDAVVTLVDSNRLMIIPGIGESAASSPIYLALSHSPADVAVVDLNDDGHPDLATTLPDDNSMHVLFGRGNQQFARPQRIEVGDKPTRVSLADADEDGRVDLVVSNSGDHTASVIYNRFDPNEVYRYDANAIDPDDDTLTYAIVDGPGGLIINAQTGELLWAAAPDQVGVHEVTISADDGRGGIATQSFKIEVEPARENRSPLIATEPVAKIGAAETFSYQAIAVDGDRDALRYRLLEGPAGATIDPVTGLLQWDARPDGAAGFSLPGSGYSGRIAVPAAPSLQSASVTVEGWFNFSQLPASNGATVIFQQTNEYGVAYQLWNNGNTSLRLELRLGPNAGPSNGFVREFFPFSTQADRWYHFALAIDDATNVASIYVDGELLASHQLPGSLAYSAGHDAQVGHSGSSPMLGRIDNYRMWNEARTAEQIRQGMYRQFDNEPALVLDYRFEQLDTSTIIDHSPANNFGYRVANSLEPQLVTGLATPGVHSFTIGVEDGRGGWDQQSFSLEILPELRGSIVGHLFDDLDGDGVQDDGSENPAEPSLEGWQLYIDTNGNAFPDPSEPQAITDTAGNYRFEWLLPGEYPVRVSPMAGYDVPSGVMPVAVSVNEASTFDLAIEQLSLSHIRGQLLTEDAEAIAYWKVFADLDDDGTLDDNEPMAVSDRNGAYALTGLDAGTYTIRPELAAGWANKAGRAGLTVTLAADEISTGNDFTLEATNTSVTGGVSFVTTPSTSVEARQTFRYASLAMGIAAETITYDLSLAPEGMTVDPTTGLVAWRPSIDQVGEHLVILRAANASGSIALHDFYLDVTAPNTPPVFSGIGILPVIARGTGSLPVNPTAYSTAYPNLSYTHDIRAQDAESTDLTYTLTNAPIGATIDPATGRISWTPAASDVGAHDFAVAVADESGSATTVTWTVDVKNETPTILPLDVRFPRSSAAVTVEYLSHLSATDQLARLVSWSLSSGPAGLTVEPDGTIRWTPGSSQLGAQSVELTATTADGTSQSVSFDIQVAGRARNAIPSIDSTPITSVSLGQTFEYDVLVSDTDRDIFSFTLLKAPVGMSVHPSLGTMRWTPAADQLGEHDVLVQVSDPSGATDTQEFKLKVSRFGGPPRITSLPPTEAGVGAAFLYSVEAVDREGDPLSYTLLTAPAGMSIVETTGEISWTPASGQLGQQDVVIQVSDGIGGAATQAFAIRVSDGVPNLPPQITSSSPRFGAVGTPYSYTLTAIDPEATTLTYSLGRGPTGMVVDAATGLVSWTPTAAQVGKSVVTLLATDAGGASAVESFEFDVLAQNRAPVIHSNAPATVAAGAMFMYDVLASDADLDQLRFNLTEAPAGADIDSFGRIRWQTDVALIGSHDFVVKVTDPRGGQAMQSFTLEVIEDLVPPKISLIENLGFGSRNILPWQGPFRVFAKAIDNVAVASLTLTANGQDIPLDAAGAATFIFEDWTFQSIVATATAIDTNANVTTKTITFGYSFPEGWSGAGTEDIPTATITSPSDTESVTGMVRIVGTASHADDFFGYKLSYRRADETSFTQFHESTTPVTGGELGVWDTSLLLNDEYVIRLEVATNAGVVNVAEHSVGLAGELKLGNFRLSFTDMVIPVAGIPIEITRIYDTLQADRQGDFGYGWRLEYRNTDLRVGLPKSGLEDIGIYSPLRPGVKVYLNVPGEGRQGFTFNPDIRVLPGFGGQNLVLARPRFTPDPGVTSSLSTGTSSYLQVNERGELYAPGGIPYNPASPDFGGAYVLTTREGITYRIDGASGTLETATDRNGNVLKFSDEGVVSDSGLLVQVHRNSTGLIERIIDPNGEAVRYAYSAGRLVASTDRLMNRTEYTYSSASHNYLVSITDPLGRLPIRTEFDASGRITRITDSTGISVNVNFDPNSLIETVVDALGNEKLVSYDQFGNQTASVDALGHVFHYEYDSQGSLKAETNPLGERTIFRRNSSGQIVARVDAEGFATAFTYDAKQNRTSVVDPLGRSTRYEYDERGNRVNTISPSGASERSEFDALGQLTATIDAVGDRTEIQRNQHGWISAVTNELGNTETRSYDNSGRLLRASVTRLTNGQNETITSEFVYDAAGNIVARTNPDGSLETFAYDASGLITTGFDSIGRQTDYERGEGSDLVALRVAGVTLLDNSYDSLGRRQSVETADGQTQSYEHDALGRPTRISTTAGGLELPGILISYDALGRPVTIANGDRKLLDRSFDSRGNVIADSSGLGETRRGYDAAGQLTQEFSDGKTTTYQYDLDGNLIAVKSAGEADLEYRYDGAGQLIEERLGGEITRRYRYDEAGQLVQTADAEGNLSQYSYDELGNLLSYTDALGRHTLYEYDSLGRITAVTSPNGRRTESSYDAAGRLEVSSYGDASINLEYDAFNRVIRRTDADQQVLFTYDERGRIATMVDGRGTTSFTHDDYNRLTRRLDPNGLFLEYEYDEFGNVSQLTTPDGSRSYVYNQQGLVTESTDTAGRITTFEYDEFGRRIRTEYSSGLYEQLSYIRDTLLASHVIGDASGALLEIRYTYDQSDRIVSETRTDGKRVHYTYDSNGQLTSEKHFSLSSLERLIEYRYDATGNRLSRSDSIEGITRYNYNLDDQLIEKTFAADTFTYTYDPQGNLVSVQKNGNEHLRYEWSSGGRLLSTQRITPAGTLTEAYLYDGFGVRVGTVTDSGETSLLYDSNGGLSEVVGIFDESGSTVRSISSVAGHRNIESQNESIIAIEDHRGSTRYLYDPSNGDLKHAVFDGFGRSLNSVAGGQFMGEFADELSGLVYLRARYYDPEDGRFMSVDPLEGIPELPITRHDYAYAGNDPLNQSDATGMSTLSEQLANLTIKNALFWVGISQGLVAAISVALNSSIKWGGPVYSLGIGDFNFARSDFESDPIGGDIGEVDVLTISKSVGASLSLAEGISKRAKDKKVRALKTNSDNARALVGKKSKAYRRARQNLGDAKKQSTYAKPEDLLGIGIGDADIYTPAWMGHTGYAMLGAFLSGSVGGSASFSRGNVSGIAGGGSGSLAIAAAVYGFGVGFTFKDTGIGAGIKKTSNSGAGVPDISIGFSVDVGVSIPSYTTYR